MKPRRISASIARRLRGVVQGSRRTEQPTGTNEFERSVSQADAFRDGGDWIAAERYYRRALELRPDQAALWIQRGHALKESGKRHEGLECYLEAVRLEPDNSDTALQIGHVLKLLDQRDQAMTWYERAAQWRPFQPDAVVELEYLGYPTARLCRLVEDAPPLLSGHTHSDAPRRRLVFWDVSGCAGTGIADVGHSLLAQWSFALLDSMAAAFPIHVCCLDLETLSWKASADPYVPAGGFVFDSRIPDVLGNHDAGENSETVIVLPFVPSEVPGARLRFACDILRNRHDVRYISLVPPGPVPKQSRHASSPGKRGDIMTRLLIDDLLAIGDSIVLADCGDGHSLPENRSAHSVHMHRVGENVPTATVNDFTRESGRRRTFDLLVMPENASELRCVLSAYRTVADQRILKVVATNRVDALTTDAAVEADGVRLCSVAPFEAMEAMRSAAVVLVPASCGEQALWACLAAEAGARVIVASRPGALDIRSPLLTTLPTFTDATKLAGRWLHVADHALDDDYFRGRWLTALTRATDDCFNRPKIARQRPIRIGEFHSLATGGSGLALRASSDWGEPAAHGSVLRGEHGSLRLTVRPFSRSPLKMAFLVGAPDGAGHGVRAHVAIDGLPTGTVDLRIPASSWGWMSLTRSLRPRIEPYVIDIDLQMPHGETFHDRPPLAVAGLFLYHESRDHTWFEFLERASRGDVPEMRSIRTWSTVVSFQPASTDVA